jgi:protoporphyrinogen oxidase
MRSVPEESEVFDYVILGCGISALTAAKHLLPEHLVLLVEAYEEPGGNHRSSTIDGMEFDIGAICFNTTDEQFKHFPELLAACLPKQIDVKKICPEGYIGTYPFDWQAEIAPLSARGFLSCFFSLLFGRLSGRSQEDAQAFARARIGDKLYRRVGLDLYIARLFGIGAENIDYDFALKRMQWLSRKTSLRFHLRSGLELCLKRTQPAGEMVVRPPGGFAAYYERALDRLKQQGAQVLLNEEPLAIEPVSGLTRVKTTRGTYHARKVISTVPLDTALELCGLPPTNLPAVTLLSLFFGLRGSWGPNCSILYNFHRNGRWKRITMHSDFYPGPGSYDKHGTIEITVPPGQALPIAAEAFAEVEEHLREVSIFDGDLVLLGSSNLLNAYPIPEKGFKLRRDAAVAELASRNVICLGRQGKFEYIPHSNIASKEVIATLDQAPAKPRAVHPPPEREPSLAARDMAGPLRVGQQEP